MRYIYILAAVIALGVLLALWSEWQTNDTELQTVATFQPTPPRQPDADTHDAAALKPESSKVESKQTDSEEAPTALYDHEFAQLLSYVTHAYISDDIAALLTFGGRLDSLIRTKTSDGILCQERGQGILACANVLAATPMQVALTDDHRYFYRALVSSAMSLKDATPKDAAVESEVPDAAAAMLVQRLLDQSQTQWLLSDTTKTVVAAALFRSAVRCKRTALGEIPIAQSCLAIRQCPAGSLLETIQTQLCGIVGNTLDKEVYYPGVRNLASETDNVTVRGAALRAMRNMGGEGERYTELYAEFTNAINRFQSGGKQDDLVKAIVPLLETYEPIEDILPLTAAFLDGFEGGAISGLPTDIGFALLRRALERNKIEEGEKVLEAALRANSPKAWAALVIPLRHWFEDTGDRRIMDFLERELSSLDAGKLGDEHEAYGYYSRLSALYASVAVDKAELIRKSLVLFEISVKMELNLARLIVPTAIRLYQSRFTDSALPDIRLALWMGTVDAVLVRNIMGEVREKDQFLAAWKELDSDATRQFFKERIRANTDKGVAEFGSKILEHLGADR